MGMANLYLAKGQIDEAMEVCMEIIRQGIIFLHFPYGSFLQTAEAYNRN